MFRYFIILILLLFPVLSYADVTDTTNATYTMLTPLIANMAASLQKISIKLFFTLTLLQLVITGYGMVASGDIEASLGKFAKAFIWIAFCVWMMTDNTASNFFKNTVQYFLNHAIGWATGGAADFDAGSILQSGMDGLNGMISGVMTSAVPSSAGGLLVGFLGGPAGFGGQLIFAILMIGITTIVIIVTCGYIALKVFMIKIEATIVMAILPLSISFLGLNALREQGFAPFKTMLALVYRIVILGMIVGGVKQTGDGLVAYAQGKADPNLVQVCLVAVFGFLVMAFLAHKSDSIAASLANGSANLGSGDAVGSAIAAGAAAGAAVAGASMIAGTSANAAKSIGETMQGLSGGGSVTNASTMGQGKPADPAPAKANASIGASPKDSGAPTRSANASSTGTNAAPSDSGSKNSAAPLSSQAEAAPSGGETSSATPASGATPASPGSSDAASSTSSNASPTSSPGNGQNASMDSSAPQRDMAQEIGKLVDHLTAPKKATHGEKMKQHMSTLGQHASNEKQATHVSVNTNPHD